MRQIMRTFGTLAEQPRVLGLTATLLNANTKPANVMKEVAALEVTYHGKVATVEELRHVIGFATNPCEQLKPFNTHRLSAVELWALGCLEEMVQLLEEVREVWVENVEKCEIKQHYFAARKCVDVPR